MTDATKVGESAAGKLTHRCHCCGNARSNVTRILQKRDSLEDDWKKLGKTVKADFMLKARGMTGTDMEMQMETTIKDECKQKIDRAFEGKGDWLDEVDVKEKFKAKPEQGDAVIKNAEQFYDTEREVILYRQNNYTSTDKAAESRGKVVTRKASSTDIA